MAEGEKLDAQCPVIFDQKSNLYINYEALNHLLRGLMDKDEETDKNVQSWNLRVSRYSNLAGGKLGNKCPSHKKEDLLMYCNTCNCPICRECVTSGVHQNHPIVKVEEVIDTKHKQLSNIIWQTNEKSEKYNDTIKTVTQNKLEFSDTITKKIEEVKTRNKQLKRRLDKWECDLIQQLQNIDKEHKKAMTELEQRLQEEMSDLKQLIQQCEREQRERNIEIVKFVTDVTQRLDKYRPCDPPDKKNPPDLITTHVDDEDLKTLFGHLDMKTTVNPSLPLKENVPSVSDAIDVMTEGSFTSDMTHVVTTSNDEAWLWKEYCTGISLVTSDGEVKQKIDTDFPVYDAAVSTSGALFVTMHIGNTIKKLTRDDTFKDIHTIADDYITRGITVTDTGNVLVVLYKYHNSKIVEISTSGQHIGTIQHDDTVDQKLLFTNPFCICSNRNGDIAVIDLDKVVVVNLQGQKRFIYQGEGKQPQKSFHPIYLVTDKHGHIIISDKHNSVVHVLDKDGKFLQYLMRHENGCKSPHGLALDNHGRLLVCNTGKILITIIKYV